MTGFVLNPVNAPENMQLKSTFSISEVDLFESGARATPGDPSWSTLSTQRTTTTMT